MDTEKIKQEFLRLNTRDAAHHAALRVIFSEGAPALRVKLRSMAAAYGDLSLATSIPDECNAELQRTLLSLAGDDKPRT